MLMLAALLFASPAALGSLPSARSAAVVGPVRQNVLMLVADDLNGVMGCAGHPIVKTPNIGALSRQGVR